MSEYLEKELIARVRRTHKYLENMRKKIINEPESEIKYAKFEQVQLLINRTAEIVNWYDNVERKEVNRRLHEKEMARHEEKVRLKKERAERFEKAQKDILGTYEQEWNKTCKYYNEDSYGEKYCSIGMDMTFCTKDCAYGSNVKGHTKVYKEERILRGKR